MRRPLAVLALLGAPLLIAADLAPASLRPAVNAADAPFAAMQALGEARAAEARADWTSAEARFALVLRLDPQLHEARRGLARSRLSRGDAPGADAALHGTDAPVLRALVDLRLGRHADPQGALESAFAQTSDPRLLVALGRWHDEAGRGEQARRVFARAAPHQPPGTAQANIGLSLLREGQLERAQIAFDMAERMDPDAFGAHARLCALRRGDIARGLRGVSGPQAAPLLRDAGESAMMQNEPRLARLLLERARDLSARHDPRTQAMLDQLEDQRANPGQHAQRHAQR